MELSSHHFDLDNGLEDLPTQLPALPDFSFNPGASRGPVDQNLGCTLREFSFKPGASLGSDGSLLSPPHSPMAGRTPPARQGHRRYGSELVGGNPKTGEVITVMGTSPTKSEGSVPSPTLAPVNPSRRRGHAHQRSKAISSHDLSMILKPPSPNIQRGNSAPTSPTDFDGKAQTIPEITLDSVQSEGEVELKEEVNIPRVVLEISDPPTPEANTESRPAARARVGFSDTLEFIPRPLSQVSTDTGSTATVRPGHSASGSISSMVSVTNSTIADREVAARFDSLASNRQSDSRPSTAGAILEHTLTSHTPEEEPQSPRRRNSIPLLINFPQAKPGSSANPSPTKTPKRWTFFGLESFASSGSPTKSRPPSSHSTGTGSRTSVLPKSSSEQDPDANANGLEPQSTSGNLTVKKKKQKRVKTWAGSILTRTAKSRSRKKAVRRRSSTPTLPRPKTDEELGDNDEEGFVEAIGAPTPMVTVTEPPSDYSSATEVRPVPDDDAAYPMIDLDAALGPFNTPSARDSEWEAAQKSGTSPRRQLHSAAGMRNFTGPGMHYHRRAESAPALAPFEAGRFGIPRFGSSSTMADVFEEDEEDEDEGGEAASENSGTESPNGSAEMASKDNQSHDSETTPIQEHDIGVAVSKDVYPTNLAERKDSDHSLDIQLPVMKMRSENPVNVLGGYDFAAEDNKTRSYDSDANVSCFWDALDSPAPSPRCLVGNNAGAAAEPTAMNLPGPSFAPSSPYSPSYSSSYPSPRTPVSCDAQRISTAASSVADENNFQSLLMGEPGPEVVRMSFDVPSLTSTNSTMTRDSVFMPPVQPRNMPFHDQRPASFSATAFGRRRSSLAGLSRLISSAHGERSKLNVAVSCDDEPEKKSRFRKAKRFSRILQFWKPKESKHS